ncbi:MAG: protein jag [Solirubrobacteraceae bacterium]
MGAEADGETVDYVAEILETIAEGIGVDATVAIDESGEGITAEYIGEDLALLVGRHGATIDAIQHLAYRLAFHGVDRRRPLTVDAAGYRARRAEVLRGLADQAAESAVRERRPVRLEPMGAQERKVVHEYLKQRFDVETYSEGNEPSRRLVVAPAGG